MHKLIFSMILALFCIANRAMSQPPAEPTAALYMILSPWAVRTIVKIESAKGVTYQGFFPNGDRITCSQDKQMNRSAKLKRGVVPEIDFFSNKNDYYSEQEIDNGWFDLLEKVHERRLTLRSVAQEKLEQHWREAQKMESIKLSSREQFHLNCIQNWQHRLNILDFLETPTERIWPPLEAPAYLTNSTYLI